VTSFTPGTTTANSFDNIAISRFNQVLIQEDVGNNARLGRLWMYDIIADSMLEIGISDSTRFLTGGSNFIGTQDEETSGIVDAWDTIGPGWWLLNMQSHNQLGGELVEGGQLMAVFIPQTVPTPGALAVVGLGGLFAARRRRA
jgi:MYXO-CTERM domain-containing protein